MRKHKILHILLTSVLIGSITTSLFMKPILAFAATPLDTLDKSKVLEMNFNNNNAINIVNNKEYTPTTNNANYVSSIKGNGYEANNSKIIIPFNHLGITSNDSVLTVSFLMKYGGSANNFMPIGISGYGEGDVGANDLWFCNGVFGFNTGKGDNIGIRSPFVKDAYYSVIAEFNAHDVSKNKLYINGVKQDISYLLNTSSYKNGWNEKSSFSIGGFVTNNIYNVSDTTVIDEVKIYKKSLTTDEINVVSKSHNTPELRTEIVNNNISVNWATEMLSENILWSTSYEENDVRPGLTWSSVAWDGEKTFDFYGSQSFSTEESYTGRYSLRVGDTRYGYNQKWEPITGETGGVSFSYFKDNIYGIPSGSKLSVSFRAKSATGAKYAFMPIITGNNTLEEFWSVAYENRLKPVSINGQPIVVTEDFTLSNYGKWITLNDVSWIPTFDDGRVKNVVLFYDFTGNQKYIKKNMVRLNQVNKATNQVFLSPTGTASTLNIKAGTQLQERQTATVTSIAPAYIDSGGAVFRNDANFNYQTNTEWQLYNFNGVVYDEKDCYYNSATEGLYFTIRKATEGVAYIDDIKVGYSTKVRLYRNNNKVYEGYDSTFNDKSATDNASPNAVSNINYKMNVDNNSNKDINITFNASKDNGTSYNYNIISVDKNNIESPLSNTHTQTITSGIKGYSYIIDKSPSTIPDNTVDTTTTSIKHTIQDSGVHYLHIKAIDNAGNVSSVVHHTIDIPSLTAKADSNNNLIKLNWTLSDSANKIFKIYQKHEGSDTFQSISTTNFESSKKVKVLNIYPTAKSGEAIPLKTDGSIDLAGKIESDSALLNDWIKEYGLGKIDVASINKEDFELEPNKYLKDAQGNYLYDVIVVGFWNINFRESHINDNGMKALSDFVDSGRGILTGHHHIGLWQLDHGMNKLKDKFGVKFVVEKGWESTEQTPIQYDYIAPETSTDRWRSNYWHASDKVIAKKQGLLLNYPWNISQEGRIFNIPYGHNSNDFVTGDVWLEYYDAIAHNINGNPPAHSLSTLPDGTKGSKSAYLSTFNNTALIQTGHSSLNGKLYATEDEKKILANTIFYLNQIAYDTSLTDNSGQDVKAPDAPSVKLLSSKSNQLRFDFSETKDNGSKYEYYVVSEDKLGNKLKSNTVSATITTGIKGYSYVLDTKPTTEPSNIVNLTNNNLTINNLDNNAIYYLHIKAIDNANNVSKTTHFKISTSAPIAPVLNLSRTGWGTTDATFTISQNHNKNVKILSLSSRTPSPLITRLQRLGYNIVSNPNLTNIEEIKKYDIVISDGYFWTVENAALLNQLYNNGVKLITGGNDTDNSILPIVSTTSVGSEADLTIARFTKNEATFALPSYNPGDDTLSYIITQAMSNSTIWYKTTSFNSPSIISIQNGTGGEWIHTQSVLSATASRQSDELIMGLIDYLTKSISPFHLQDVQYKINDGNWIPYNGEEIVLSNEGNYNISVRNIDTRGVASIVDTKTVGIDRTAPKGIAYTNKTTTSRHINVTLDGLEDKLSGLNKVRISNYSNFKDSTGYTSISNKNSIDLKIELPFLSDLEENYSSRTIYIEIQDKVGNKKILTCSTIYEPKNPTVVITSPKNNTFFATNELVTLSWAYKDNNNDNVVLPQSKAVITVTNLESNNAKILTTTINGSSTKAVLPALDTGEYSITVTVYNSLDKHAVSEPIQIRCNVFSTTGYLNTIPISIGSPLRFISVFSEVEIPIGTEIKGYIYYAENMSDDFNEQNKLEFLINSNQFSSDIIKLPTASSKIKLYYGLYNKSTNKQLSPALCHIIVFGK